MYGVSNYAKTTLNEALDTSETGIDVVDASEFSDIFTTVSSIRSFVLTIWSSSYDKPSQDSGRERVLVKFINSNTLTVVRGYDGTSASEHASGDNIALFANASNFQQILDVLPFGEYGTVVAKSRPTRTGLVTFWFDDGPATDYTVLRGLFAAQGEVGVLSLVTDIADGGASLTWAQAHTMEDEGWEITNHSKTHTHLTSFTEAQLESELLDSIASFRAQGFDPKIIAYPYNACNRFTKRIIRKYFVAGRANGHIVNPKALDHYELQSYDIDAFNLTEIYKLVDQAKRTNSWLIFYGHSAGYDAGKQTSLNTLIDYVQTAGIPIVTATQGLEIMGNTIESGQSFGVGEEQVRLTAHSINPDFIDGGGAGTVVANTAVGPSETIELGTATTALITLTQGMKMTLTAGTFMFEFTPSESSVDPTIFRDNTTGYYIRWRGSLNALYFYQDGSHLATFSTSVPNVDNKKTHVAFTMSSAGKVTCYVDGVSLGENATVFTVAPIFTEIRNYLSTTSIRVGNVRVWNATTLTQQEIWNEMYSRYAVKIEGLTHQFKGNHYHGTDAAPTKFANIKQFPILFP